MIMHVLPATGGGTGNPWYAAVRDGDKNLLFEVVSWESVADAMQRAHDMVRRLNIAAMAIDYCRRLCEPDRHVPNCPVADVDSGHEAAPEAPAK